MLQQGDENAFRELVATYQQQVMNTALSMVQDMGMAEDITQEVFIKVFKSILAFKGQSSLSTWIYRITVNKCLDHLRALQNKRNAGLFGSLFVKDNGAPVVEASDFVHPGVLAERREQARYLFKAIESLPLNQKTAFVLAHIEELPQKEIAEIMDLSIKAVESLLQRAKVNLREKLSDIYDRRIFKK